MAHTRRNMKLVSWRTKKANHGSLGSIGKEKSQFKRYRRAKDKNHPLNIGQ